MSLWGVHVGFAGIVTVLVLALLGVGRWKRWLLVAASGVWAIVPDLYHLVPAIPPWYKPLVHDAAVANVFWLHRAIDRANPGDQVLFGLVGWAGFLAVFLAVESWCLWRRDGRAASPGAL